MEHPWVASIPSVYLYEAYFQRNSTIVYYKAIPLDFAREFLVSVSFLGWLAMILQSQQ
jgi:hypothetical protein